MEKKIYNKPEVSCTEIDCHITMTGVSDFKPGPDVPDPEAFVNPLKWFK